MEEIIAKVEVALGETRLMKLRADPDRYQQFWLGVLEACGKVDWSRDYLGYLITSGYGSIRNMRRHDRSRGTFRVCPSCGRSYGYRPWTCKYCGADLEYSHRDVLFEDYHPSPVSHFDRELHMDIERYVDTLEGKDRYIARRWMIERADLRYANHLKQIGTELGISAARVAQLKRRVRLGLLVWLNRDEED